MSEDQKHHVGCYVKKGHHMCAIAEIDRLRKELDQYKDKPYAVPGLPFADLGSLFARGGDT